MRLNNFLLEKKWMERTMIGYGVEWRNIEKISTTIGSWLDHNNLVYNQIKTPHITIAMITGRYPKDEIAKKMMVLPKNFNMKPKKLKLLWGMNVKKWFIGIEYERVPEFVQARKQIKEIFPEVVEFKGGQVPHVSLFSIENDFDLYIWNEISQRDYSLPSIKTGKVQLYNKKFEIEFEHRG